MTSPQSNYHAPNVTGSGPKIRTTNPCPRIFPLCHSLWRTLLFQYQICIQHLPRISLCPQDGPALLMFSWKRVILCQPTQHPSSVYSLSCLPRMLTGVPYHPPLSSQWCCYFPAEPDPHFALVSPHTRESTSWESHAMSFWGLGLPFWSLAPKEKEYCSDIPATCRNSLRL